MFENIANFFRKLMKSEKKESGSRDAAKERLHLVLMQDRANVSADFLELMKQEIIEVIKKYIEVDEKEIDVRLTNKENEDGTNGAPALYANIPILNIRNEMKKEVMTEKQEEPKEEKQESAEEQKENESTTVGASIDRLEEAQENVEEIKENQDNVEENITHSEEAQENENTEDNNTPSEEAQENINAEDNIAHPEEIQENVNVGASIDRPEETQ